MKIQFYVRGFNVGAGARQDLERSLQSLQSLIPISDAAVVLEAQQNTAPNFRAFVTLAVSGPDLHAEGRDHTLEAAWRKVITALRAQIERRNVRFQTREKSNGHLRAPAGLRGRGLAAVRV